MVLASIFALAYTVGRSWQESWAILCHGEPFPRPHCTSLMHLSLRRYCLFGDTVNTASRMESNGIAGRIHCSATTSDLLSASGLFDIALRGAIDVKGKGTMTTYWLEGAKERNEKANGLAIERTQNMVQELLDAEKDHSEGSGDEFDDIPLIGDVVSLLHVVALPVLSLFPSVANGRGRQCARKYQFATLKCWRASPVLGFALSGIVGAFCGLPSPISCQVQTFTAVRA